MMGCKWKSHIHVGWRRGGEDQRDRRRGERGGKLVKWVSCRCLLHVHVHTPLMGGNGGGRIGSITEGGGGGTQHEADKQSHTARRRRGSPHLLAAWGAWAGCPAGPWEVLGTGPAAALPSRRDQGMLQRLVETPFCFLVLTIGST